MKPCARNNVLYQLVVIETIQISIASLALCVIKLQMESGNDKTPNKYVCMYLQEAHNFITNAISVKMGVAVVKKHKHQVKFMCKTKAD